MFLNVITFYNHRKVDTFPSCIMSELRFDLRVIFFTSFFYAVSYKTVYSGRSNVITNILRTCSVCNQPNLLSTTRDDVSKGSWPKLQMRSRSCLGSASSHLLPPASSLFLSRQLRTRLWRNCGAFVVKAEQPIITTIHKNHDINSTPLILSLQLLSISHLPFVPVLLHLICSTTRNNFNLKQTVYKNSVACRPFLLAQQQLPWSASVRQTLYFSGSVVCWWMKEVDTMCRSKKQSACSFHSKHRTVFTKISPSTSFWPVSIDSGLKSKQAIHSKWVKDSQT